MFLAQPILWGLTYNGQKGVENVLSIVINEFDNAMALTGICSYFIDIIILPTLFQHLLYTIVIVIGCTSLEKIEKEMVVHESTFSKL